MSEPLDLPDGWNYGPDRRPPRSLLAGIDPIGVGTQFAESLAGYAVRLSWRHGHALARLVRDVLAPALGHPSAVDADRAAWEEELARVTRHASGSILGHAPVAGTWADALGAAIGRPVLRCLTTLAWADVLPSKRLLRAVRAWCPACLEIRRLRGLPAYEPLLWQFTEVTACVEHEVTLVTACPSCGMEGGVLTAWARAGWCRCGTWLGSLWFHEDAIIDGEDLAAVCHRPGRRDDRGDPEPPRTGLGRADGGRGPPVLDQKRSLARRPRDGGRYPPDRPRCIQATVLRPFGGTVRSNPLRQTGVP